MTVSFLCVSGYNDLKSELKDFLQRFAAEGKVSLTSDVFVLEYEQVSLLWPLVAVSH